MKLASWLAAVYLGLFLISFDSQTYRCGAFTPEERVKHDLVRLHDCAQELFVRTGKPIQSWEDLHTATPSVDPERDFVDPWGKPYIAQVCMDGDSMRIATRGRDGVLGGRGEDADRSVEFVLGEGEFIFLGINL